MKPNERTGFYRNDVVGKLRLHSDEDAEIRQALELKLGFSNEHSDESYVGLSEQDFASRPYYRYRGAQMDQLQTRHTQTALTHLVDFTGGLKVTTSAYYNYFWRNWYKLNDVRIGDQKGEKRSIEEILADPETNARYLDILTGATDRLGEALMLRANQRSYHRVDPDEDRVPPPLPLELPSARGRCPLSCRPRRPLPARR